MHITRDLLIEELPADCVKECSSPGPCDEAAEYWRKELNLTVDRANAIICLKGYGAWELAELQKWDQERLAETVLWLAAGNFHEWDGTRDSPCGSDIFVL